MYRILHIPTGLFVGVNANNQYCLIPDRKSLNYKAEFKTKAKCEHHLGLIVCNFLTRSYYGKSFMNTIPYVETNCFSPIKELEFNKVEYEIIEV